MPVRSDAVSSASAISPPPAWTRTLRPTSEIAVAIRVASVREKPSRAASARPSARATTMSASPAIATEISSAIAAASSREAVEQCEGFVEVQRNGQVDTASSGRKTYHGAPAPMIGVEPTSYGIYEQLLSAAKLGRDSASYALIAAGAGPAPAIILRRRGADSVAFTSTFFPGWTEVASVDSRGRILGIDASATTVKTVAQRVTSNGRTSFSKTSDAEFAGLSPA